MGNDVGCGKSEFHDKNSPNYDYSVFEDSALRIAVPILTVDA